MTCGTDEKGQVMHSRMDTPLKDHPKSCVLVAIHTHTDVNTGYLCNSYSPDGVTVFISPVNEVCDFNLGAGFMSALRQCTATKGLLLLACRPTMCDPHYVDVAELVSKCVCSIATLIAAHRLTTVLATCLTLS